MCTSLLFGKWRSRDQRASGPSRSPTSTGAWRCATLLPRPARLVRALRSQLLCCTAPHTAVPAHLPRSLHKKFADTMTRKKELSLLQVMVPKAQGDDFAEMHSSMLEMGTKVQLRKVCFNVFSKSGDTMAAKKEIVEQLSKLSKDELCGKLQAAWGDC